MKRLHWLVLLASFFAVEAGAQTKIRFTLDWVFEGQTSFMHMANYKGWFKEEGLEVQVDGVLTPRRAGGDPPRLRDVHYTVFITSPAPAQEIDALRQAVEAVCPIYNLLKAPQTITGQVIREGFNETTARRQR